MLQMLHQKHGTTTVQPAPTLMEQISQRFQENLTTQAHHVAVSTKHLDHHHS
jgi:hypothetical protein